MIDKIAANERNTDPVLKLNSPEEVKRKLDYYRSLFGKVQDLSDEEFENLKKDVHKFFNIFPFKEPNALPERLVRITNNNRIFAGQGKEVSYLTDISQLLAPPTNLCKYGRCNQPEEQVLYCAIDLSSAYWETKPQNGDVITISHFQLKKGAKINCNFISKGKVVNPKITNTLEDIYYLIDDFFVDAFSLEVARNRPRDYIFSADFASTQQLFYPVPSDKNIEAIIYPSVQRKVAGQNMAIRNDIIFDKYDLIGVETRFILDEFENLDPAKPEPTADNLISSFGTDKFDFANGKILYHKDVDKVFNLFRMLQMGGSKQQRIPNPMGKKDILMNLSPDSNIKINL